jgi:hypothetical protein
LCEERLRRQQQQSREQSAARDKFPKLPRAHECPFHDETQNTAQALRRVMCQEGRAQGSTPGERPKEKARPGGQPDGPAVLALGVDGRSRRTQPF